MDPKIIFNDVMLNYKNLTIYDIYKIGYLACCIDNDVHTINNKKRYNLYKDNLEICNLTKLKKYLQQDFDIENVELSEPIVIKHKKYSNTITDMLDIRKGKYKERRYKKIVLPLQKDYKKSNASNASNVSKKSIEKITLQENYKKTEESIEKMNTALRLLKSKNLI